MSFRLEADGLETVEIRHAPYSLESWTIGTREHREILRNKANRSGGFDDTRFDGARAITLGIRLDDNPVACGGQSVQQLYDRLAPYFSAHRRSKLSWVLPGETDDRRQAIVRGTAAPLSMSERKPLIVANFISGDGAVISVGENYPRILRISPSSDEEAGRTYNLQPDRTYPAGNALGSRLIDVTGTDRADYKLRIFGSCVSPNILVNGTTIVWPGLVIPTGAHITIDTAAETMLFQDDPASPVTGLTNYSQWEWSDLLLDPTLAQNVIRFGADELLDGTFAELEWSPHWA